VSPKRSTPAAPPSVPDLLNRARAATYLGCDVRTLDRRTARGQIASYLIGGRRLYDPADLGALVASGYKPASGDTDR
jgi:hypothetical protein